MQHEAFANTEDFGGPDIVAGPGRICHPGQDAPYQGYELGKPYDEMFTPDGKCRPPYAVLDSRISTLPLEELNRRDDTVEFAVAVTCDAHPAAGDSDDASDAAR